MTDNLRVGITVAVDATNAKAGAAEATAAVTKLNAAVRDASTAAKVQAQDTAALSAIVQRLSSAEAAAVAAIERVAAAEAHAAQMAGQMAAAQATAAEAMARIDAMGRRVGPTFGSAAGSVGNLTAQFNDIGIMMMAGQNPLQLAIQQGTQITQVFGSMKAGGAVKSLGAALLSMVSPINLITIGGIAAGAALFQWVIGLKPEARTLTETIDDLKSAVDGYAAAVKAASAPTERLEGRFDAAAQRGNDVLDALAGIERQKAHEAIAAATKALADFYSVSDGGFDQGPLIREFDLRACGTRKRAAPSMRF